MYRFKIIALTVVLLCAAVAEGKFPKDPKPCAYGDGECIKKIIEFLFTEKNTGYGPLNLVSVNPLKISEINIRQGEESAVNIDLLFRNSELTGVPYAKVSQVKGFGKDLTQVHEIIVQAGSVSLLSDYSIKGKILILPITGTGKSNLTMENLKLTMKFRGEPLEKNGETYMNVKDLKLDIDTTRFHFDLSNLFNGDKALGDNMNQFLNENWKDIFGEVRGSITRTFEKIFKSVINNVFQKYPYAKMFAAE